jgi:hypothetical protein
MQGRKIPLERQSRNHQNIKFTNKDIYHKQHNNITPSHSLTLHIELNKLLTKIHKKHHLQYNPQFKIDGLKLHLHTNPKQLIIKNKTTLNFLLKGIHYTKSLHLKQHIMLNTILLQTQRSNFEPLSTR